MHKKTEQKRPWLAHHDHTFGQDIRRPGETRTLIVIALTGATMIAEIWAGSLFGSMALLADGLHMASHATALAITAFAYRYARKHAGNPEFSFGTGKVNALAGFTGAVLLATFAAVMAWESLQRIVNPVEIAFNQAIAVAALGLIVNGISVFILGVDDHEHEHEHDHGHAHSHHHDHNLRAAYLHVLADALTSLLAIAALLTAKFMAVVWVDPAVGILGAILVGRWSWGLLRDTSRVLLDRQAPEDLLAEIRDSLEADGCEVCDLHMWTIAPGKYAAIVGVSASEPLPADDYRKRIPDTLGLVHVSIEVCERAD